MALSVDSLRIHHSAQDSHDHAVFLSGQIEHAQSDRPVYDEQRYLVDLAQKQNAFKQNITEIQNDFASINMMLNDTNLS